MKGRLRIITVALTALALILVLCSSVCADTNAELMPATDPQLGGGFWLGVVLLGYIVPGIFLVGGLVLPRVKKTRGSKAWYALSMCAGIWMMFSLMLTVIAVLV